VDEVSFPFVLRTGDQKIAPAADAERTFASAPWFRNIHSGGALRMTQAELVLDPCEQAPCVVMVELEASNGRRWSAVGGGDTLEEAVDVARRSAPEGYDWRVVRVEDLYGD
jgi:hypothetical protein